MIWNIAGKAVAHCPAFYKDVPAGCASPNRAPDAQCPAGCLSFHHHKGVCSMLNTFIRRASRRMGALALLLLAGLLPLTLATAKAATTGEQRTVVILVNFQDLATQPISKAAAHSLVFGKVSDFYWEASYQKTFFSGDSFGWFTVPVSSGVCDIQLLAREADKAATAAGADLSTYDRIIYLAPNNVCTATGYNSGITRPTRTWLFSDAPDAGDLAHEIGHNFGMAHSQSLDCGTVSLSTDCIVRSFGDLADTMGSGGNTHFNAPQKDMLGWIGAAGTPGLTTVTASGRFQLAPFAAGGTAAKALKIPRAIDALTGEMSYYYVEYRQRIGFDATLLGNLTDGVLVHIGGTNQYNYLLDMTPGSDPVYDYNDWYDSALTVGRSYNDAIANIRIALVAADASGATVDVSLGAAPVQTCTRAQPTLSLSGPLTAVMAGSTLSYTASLTNRDSAGCATTTFNLARNVPQGWTGTLSAGSVSVSPGATASFTLTVTSASGAASGSYGIGVGTSSSVGSPHTASASASYSVASPSGAALIGSIGTDKDGYARGDTVFISALVKRDGVAVNGASVAFSVVLPDGSRATSAVKTDINGFARTTYKIGKGKPAVGGYGVRADITNGDATAVATGAFTVK